MEKLHILTPEREEKLWSEAIFVFDTSSICALYNLKPDSQKIVVDILERFKDRIWIPAQVRYEYVKNREKVINNPLAECYQKPQIVSSGTQWVKDFSSFLENNKNQDFHPYIKDATHKDLTQKRDELERLIKEIIKSIKTEQEERRNEIQAIKDHDCIRDAVMAFNAGSPFSFNDILGIVREGEFRYRNTIPPGYMDKDNKRGTQIYGDLIIWKEILRYVELEKKSIIFICDDLKVDWWLISKNKTVEKPRFELIKELHDIASTDFWMYTVKQFVEKLEQLNRDPSILPLYKGLEGIKYVLEIKERRARARAVHGDYIIIRCNQCGHEHIVEYDDLYFDWEAIGGSERSMGEETEYQSTEYVDCPHCGSQIDIEFHLWEYPVGVVNTTNIEIANGEIVGEVCDFSDRISLMDGSTECHRCGKIGHINEMGLCGDCEAEFNDFMERE